MSDRTPVVTRFMVGRDFLGKIVLPLDLTREEAERVKDFVEFHILPLSTHPTLPATRSRKSQSVPSPTPSNTDQ